MNNPVALGVPGPWRFGFSFHPDDHQSDGVEAVPGKERIAYLKETAVSNMKRLSKTGKEKQEIRTFIDELSSEMV
jgi:hypothetical protein